MKLDPRIIEGKRPLSCLDTDEAKKFIGKKGYFAQNLKQFADLNCILLGELLSVTTDEFFCRGLDIGYNFFMSAEWIREKEPEPVWKPYDLDSWRNDNFRIGSAITFRIKLKNEQDSKNLPVKTMIYLGREEHSDNLNDIYIYIGTIGYSFKYLFENYEIFDDKYTKTGCPRWRPFGYQE